MLILFCIIHAGATSMTTSMPSHQPSGTFDDNPNTATINKSGDHSFNEASEELNGIMSLRNNANLNGSGDHDSLSVSSGEFNNDHFEWNFFVPPDDDYFSLDDDSPVPPPRHDIQHRLYAEQYGQYSRSSSSHPEQYAQYSGSSSSHSEQHEQYSASSSMLSEQHEQYSASSSSHPEHGQYSASSSHPEHGQYSASSSSHPEYGQYPGSSSSHSEQFGHYSESSSSHSGQHRKYTGSSSSYVGQRGFMAVYQNKRRPRLLQYETPPTLQSSFLSLHPDEVVEKYATLKTPSAMSTLAVKLARESFFGKEVMKRCTPQGKTEHDSLPDKELFELKLYLKQLFPALSKADFEGYWKACSNAGMQKVEEW